MVHSGRGGRYVYEEADFHLRSGVFSMGKVGKVFQFICYIHVFKIKPGLF